MSKGIDTWTQCKGTITTRTPMEGTTYRLGFRKRDAAPETKAKHSGNFLKFEWFRWNSMAEHQDEQFIGRHTNLDLCPESFRLRDGEGFTVTDIEDDEREERIFGIKCDLSKTLLQVGVVAFPWELENDIEVHGPLSVIMEFCQTWRSEIEELG